MTVGGSFGGNNGPRIPPEPATEATVSRADAPRAPTRKTRREIRGPLAGTDAVEGCGCAAAETGGRLVAGDDVFPCC